MLHLKVVMRLLGNVCDFLMDYASLTVVMRWMDVIMSCCMIICVFKVSFHDSVKREILNVLLRLIDPKPSFIRKPSDHCNPNHEHHDKNDRIAVP